MRCQRCGGDVVPVAVAGHTQCPDCNQVIDECCSGESACIQAEGEPLVGADPGIEVGGTTHEPLPTWQFDCRACNRPNIGYGQPPRNCAFCGMAL